MRFMRFIGVFLFLLALNGFPSLGWAYERLALVIGNSNYPTAPLENPVNDAKLMATTLRAVGFDVSERLDLDRREMKRAFSDFGEKLKKGGGNTVGLIYYAGHGVQIDGENYLIPIGAQISDELDVEIEGIRASSLLGTLRDADAAMNIVILDACRNNPYKRSSRNSTRGLAKMDAPTGTLLAYSTSPGDVAEDGSGRNSTYTAALARAIKKPGAKVEEVFKRVRIDVMDRTQDRQVPWESSSLIGDFIFVEKEPPLQTARQQGVQLAYETAGELSAARPLVAPAALASETSTIIEIEYWKSIATSDNPVLFEAYLRSYPDGLFKDIAVARLDTFAEEPENSVQIDEPAPDPEMAAADRERLAWLSVRNSDDILALEAFMNIYPTGLYVDAATARIEKLKTAQVASLTREIVAPNNLPDGYWVVEVTNIRSSRTQGCPFCKPGEKVMLEVEMRNGYFEGTDFTNRNSQVTVEGEMLASGEIRIRVNSWGGEGMNKVFKRGFDRVSGLETRFSNDFYEYRLEIRRIE